MTALAAVNAAQVDYVRSELPRLHPELADVPVLAAAAAFRTGFGGPDDYTDVPAGPLTLRSAADLYFYPNTLAAVKTDGAGLKAWLEKSAQRFNRIDPKHDHRTAADQQPLRRLQLRPDPGRHPLRHRRLQAGRRAHHRTHLPGQAGAAGRSPSSSSPTTTAPTAAATSPAWTATTSCSPPPTARARSWRAGSSAGSKSAPAISSRPHGASPRSRRTARWCSPAPADKLDVAKAAGLTNIRQVKDNGDGTAVYAIDLSH